MNFMSSNLTNQVRDLLRTTRFIAEGKPQQKVTTFARGETLELKECVNAIVERVGA